MRAAAHSEQRASVCARLHALPAGVAGDEALWFVGLPLEGAVCALSRATGERVGTLPAPARGWALPFVLHSLGDNKLAVLDAGGMPSPEPFVPASPSIHEYTYTFDPAGGLRATCTRSIHFDAVTIGFAEDFLALEGGGYLISDAVLGAIWVVDADGRITPGLSGGGGALASLACSATMPRIEVGGLPFLFAGATLPGVSPLAERAGIVYFYVPSAGGLYAIPLASLLDARAPDARLADVRLVSPKPEGIAVEQLLGLTFQASRPDSPHLYAADSLQLRVVRIDVETGARALVAADPTLLSFPSSLAFVPDVGGGSTLVALSNQQHRTPLTNHALAGEQSILPYYLTAICLD